MVATSRRGAATVTVQLSRLQKDVNRGFVLWLRVLFPTQTWSSPNFPKLQGGRLLFHRGGQSCATADATSGPGSRWSRRSVLRCSNGADARVF